MASRLFVRCDRILGTPRIHHAHPHAARRSPGTLLGLFLIFLEFFVIPGITVAGIGGLIFSIAGIYMAYNNYGSATGHIILLSTIIFALILFIISLFNIFKIPFIGS